MRKDYLVIGGGLAGLSASVRLGELGAESLLLEKEAELGGLARSFDIEGFRFDCSGHLLHLRNPRLRARVLNASGSGEWLSISRESHILLRDSLIRYPFQGNLVDAPAAVRKDCLENLPKQGGSPGPYDSLDDWVRGNLGDGIAHWFMKPYNEKLFGTQLKDLLPSALGRFLPQIDQDQIREGAKRGSFSGGYNAQFLYPRRGGIDLLPQFFRERAGPIETTQQVTKVDLGAQTVMTRAGDSFSYDKAIISSVPLPEMLDACELGGTESFRARAVTCINIGFESKSDRFDDSHWVYLPEPEFFAYRLGFYSNIAPHSTPQNLCSAYVEIAHWGDLDPEQATQQAISDLLRLGLIESKKAIQITHHFEISKAYVVCTLDYEPRRSNALSSLEDEQIFQVGRYGRWEYGSMEDAIMQGAAAAESLEGNIGG